MNLQSGWRRCTRCEGLVYAGFETGRCHDGEGHAWGDQDYSVAMCEAGEEGYWQWCNRCKGLTSVMYGIGVCWDGEAHDHTWSGTYALTEGPADGEQLGWRHCNRCQYLAFGGDDFGRIGLCHDSEPHVLAESPVYSLHVNAAPTTADPAPLPPALLTITVTEQGHTITVTGEHYTPNGPVTLSFLRGSQEKKVSTVADGDGRLYYEERQASQRGPGGLVFARDETTDQVNVGATDRLFPEVFEPVPIDSGTALDPTDE